MPVFAHLEGICHLYIDRSADLDMAVTIAVNAKMRRTGICGAAETLLVDRAVAVHPSGADPRSIARGRLRDPRRCRGAAGVLRRRSLPPTPTGRPNISTPIIAVKLVDGVAGAIEHIETFSSHHTEAIVAEDAKAVENFFNEIDSAILLHNASTQFADGGEFGMGAEIGIATGKMHARGPVGVEQLTSFKYRVRGSGQVRP